MRMRWLVLGLLALLGLTGVVLWLGFSYVTSAGDETTIGARAARKLGIKPYDPYCHRIGPAFLPRRLQVQKTPRTIDPIGLGALLFIHLLVALS